MFIYGLRVLQKLCVYRRIVLEFLQVDGHLRIEWLYLQWKGPVTAISEFWFRKNVAEFVTGAW